VPLGLLDDDIDIVPQLVMGVEPDAQRAVTCDCPVVPAVTHKQTFIGRHSQIAAKDVQHRTLMNEIRGHDIPMANSPIRVPEVLGSSECVLNLVI